MEEKTEISTKQEPTPAKKEKLVIPPWAIKKVRDDEFSVFVEQRGKRVFWALVKTFNEAETEYAMYGAKA